MTEFLKLKTKIALRVARLLRRDSNIDPSPAEKDVRARQATIRAKFDDGSLNDGARRRFLGESACRQTEKCQKRLHNVSYF